jgi:hypothetical protein
VVRAERDRPQRDLMSRCCYLPVALPKVRVCRDPSNALLSRALIRLRKAGLAQHDENCGTKSSNPLPSSEESGELPNRASEAGALPAGGSAVAMLAAGWYSQRMGGVSVALGSEALTG